MPELVATSVKNCKKDDKVSSLMDSNVLQFYVCDGRKGYSAHAPYDAIHVGAASPEIPDEVY